MTSRVVLRGEDRCVARPIRISRIENRLPTLVKKVKRSRASRRSSFRSQKTSSRSSRSYFENSTRNSESKAETPGSSPTLDSENCESIWSIVHGVLGKIASKKLITENSFERIHVDPSTNSLLLLPHSNLDPPFVLKAGRAFSLPEKKENHLLPSVLQDIKERFQIEYLYDD